MRKLLFNFFILLSFLSTYSQNINSNDFDNIRRNILSYRVFYFSILSQSQFNFNNDCLLPKDGWILKIDSEPFDIKFIDNSYRVYKLSNPNYTFVNTNGNNIEIINNNGCGYVPFSYDFLIAKKDNKTICLSGMLFKDPIANLFKLKKEKPYEFYDFLNIKLYNYLLKDIKFKKYRKNKIIFEAKQSISDNVVVIEVEKNNFDNISIYYKKFKNDKRLIF